MLIEQQTMTNIPPAPERARPAMKTVSATIQIDARPAQVWAALTDLAAYPRWNPLFPEASGQIAVGSGLTKP